MLLLLLLTVVVGGIRMGTLNYRRERTSSNGRVSLHTDPVDLFRPFREASTIDNCLVVIENNRKDKWTTARCHSGQLR